MVFGRKLEKNIQNNLPLHSPLKILNRKKYMVFWRKGIGLCLHATGVNEPSDILNPYYWTKAAPTIIESVIVPYGEIRSAAKGLQLLEKVGLPLFDEVKFVLMTSLKTNAYRSFNNLLKKQAESYFVSNGIDYGYSIFGIEILE